MRLRLLMTAVAALSLLALGGAARAEPGGVLVPANHGFGWNAYPPSILTSPSNRTCRQVSKPNSGWLCSFEKPPFIAKPYDDEQQDVRAKPAKKKQAKRLKRPAG